MNGIDSIRILDGNSYLVKNSSGVNRSDEVSFDEVYKSIGLDVSESLESIFNEASEKYKVNVNLLKAVAKAESGFDANAESYCGAQGMMQLMPFVSEAYGVTDPFDAKQSILTGARILSEHLDTFDGNATLALAAYNAGAGSVSRYGGVPPYDETLGYIEKINSFLGGALSNDSKTIEGSSATDLSYANDITAEGTYVNNNISNASSQEVHYSMPETASPTTGFSYDDYLYVLETIKELLDNIFSANSNIDDDNLAYKLYNISRNSTSSVISKLYDF